MEVLDLSHNKICDLIEFEMCSSIIKLNLRNNCISEAENISFLSGMTSLKWLNLNENPIKKLTNYEELIKDKLRDLENLDEDYEILLNTLSDELSFDERLNTKNSMDCIYKI